MSDAERGYDLQLRLAKALGVRVLSPYDGMFKQAMTATVSPGYLDADENASNAPFVAFKLKLPLDQLERLVERLEMDAPGVSPS